MSDTQYSLISVNNSNVKVSVSTEVKIKVGGADSITMSQEEAYALFKQLEGIFNPTKVEETGTHSTKFLLG